MGRLGNFGGLVGCFRKSLACSNRLVGSSGAMSSRMRTMATSSPTTGKLLVDNCSIEYLSKGSGPHPILLLPGALGTSPTDFSPQIEELGKNENFTVVGWDPPGYGGSRPPARTFPDDWFYRDANMAVATMKALGHETFSLVGWSDGGITAMIAAAKYPENVRKLVVWGANAYIADEDIGMIENVADVSKWSDRMRAPMEAIYGDEFPSLWKAWCDAYIKIHRDGGDVCTKELKNIVAPTLAIHGAKDAMVLGEHIHHLNENIKGSKIYIFEDGKHNLHFKYKKEFNEMVANFLIE